MPDKEKPKKTEEREKPNTWVASKEKADKWLDDLNKKAERNGEKKIGEG